MPKAKAPKSPKLSPSLHKTTQMEQSGELRKNSQSGFSPLVKGKFLKGKKKLF